MFSAFLPLEYTLYMSDSGIVTFVGERFPVSSDRSGATYATCGADVKPYCHIT